MTQQQSGAQRIANPQFQIIQAQNAARVGRRRAASTLAAQVGRTGSASLQRGFNRQVGGTFETLQELPPEDFQIQQQSLSDADLRQFLDAFRFEPRREVLARSQSSTVGSSSAFSFQTRNEIIRASRRSRLIDPFTGRSSPFSTRSGLFGGTIISPF